MFHSTKLFKPTHLRCQAETFSLMSFSCVFNISEFLALKTTETLTLNMSKIYLFVNTG